MFNTPLEALKAVHALLTENRWLPCSDTAHLKNRFDLLVRRYEHLLIEEPSVSILEAEWDEPEEEVIGE